MANVYEMEESRMTSKRFYMLLVLVLVAILMGGCVRSASTPPESLVTPPSEVAEEGTLEEAPPGEGAPVPTSEVISQLQQFATQTAAAAMGTGGEQPTAVPGSEGQAAPGETPAMPAEAPVTGATQPAGEAQPPAELVPTQAPPMEQPTQAAPQEQPTQAPPPGAIVVPTATPGIPASYELKPGEFPYCIARRFDVNPTDLLNLNGLSTGQIVRPGTVLKIPQSGSDFPGNRALKAHPTTYTVQGGENLYEIACKFGDVSPDAIVYANGLQSPYTLSSGQQLYIP